MVKGAATLRYIGSPYQTSLSEAGEIKYLYCLESFPSSHSAAAASHTVNSNNGSRPSSSSRSSSSSSSGGGSVDVDADDIGDRGVGVPSPAAVQHAWKEQDRWPFDVGKKYFKVSFPEDLSMLSASSDGRVRAGDRVVLRVPVGYDYAAEECARELMGRGVEVELRFESSSQGYALVGGGRGSNRRRHQHPQQQQHRLLLQQRGAGQQQGMDGTELARGDNDSGPFGGARRVGEELPLEGASGDSDGGQLAHAQEESLDDGFDFLENSDPITLFAIYMESLRPPTPNPPPSSSSSSTFISSGSSLSTEEAQVPTRGSSDGPLAHMDAVRFANFSKNGNIQNISKQSLESRHNACASSTGLPVNNSGVNAGVDGVINSSTVISDQSSGDGAVDSGAKISKEYSSEVVRRAELHAAVLQEGKLTLQRLANTGADTFMSTHSISHGLTPSSSTDVSSVNSSSSAARSSENTTNLAQERADSSTITSLQGSIHTLMLESVTLKNFGPYGGAEPTEYPLAKRGLVLLKGQSSDGTGADSNGSGKTTLAMSVMWGLIGSMDARLVTDGRAADVAYDGPVQPAPTFTHTRTDPNDTNTRENTSRVKGKDKGKGKGKGRSNKASSSRSAAVTAEVAVRGTINGVSFEVLRKRKKSGSSTASSSSAAASASGGSSELRFWVDGRDMTLQSVKDTQALIDSTLGVGNGLLQRCSFFGQHSHTSQSLLGLTDAKLKTELSLLVNTEVWGVALQDARKRDLAGKHRVKELDIEERMRTGEDATRLQNAITDCNTNAAALRSELQDLEVQKAEVSAGKGIFRNIAQLSAGTLSKGNLSDAFATASGDSVSASALGAAEDDGLVDIAGLLTVDQIKNELALIEAEMDRVSAEKVLPLRAEILEYARTRTARGSSFFTSTSGSNGISGSDSTGAKNSSNFARESNFGSKMGVFAANERASLQFKGISSDASLADGVLENDAIVMDDSGVDLSESIGTIRDRVVTLQSSLHAENATRNALLNRTAGLRTQHENITRSMEMLLLELNRNISAIHASDIAGATAAVDEGVGGGVGVLPAEVDFGGRSNGFTRRSSFSTAAIASAPQKVIPTGVSLADISASWVDAQRGLFEKSVAASAAKEAQLRAAEEALHKLEELQLLPHPHEHSSRLSDPFLPPSASSPHTATAAAAAPPVLEEGASTTDRITLPVNEQQPAAAAPDGLPRWGVARKGFTRGKAAMMTAAATASATAAATQSTLSQFTDLESHTTGQHRGAAQGEGGDACPTCGQGMPHHTRAQRLQHLLEEVTHLRAAVNATSAATARYRLSYDLASQLKALETQRTDLADRLAEAQREEAALLESVTSKQREMERENDLLRRLVAEQEGLERHWIAIERAKEAELRDAEQTLQEMAGRVVLLKRNLAVTEESAALQAEHLRQLNTSIALVEERLLANSAALQQHTAQWEEVQERLSRLRSERREIVERGAVLERLAAALGPRGIQNFIFQGVIRQIENAANDYLEILADGGIQLALLQDDPTPSTAANPLRSSNRSAQLIGSSSGKVDEDGNNALSAAELWDTALGGAAEAVLDMQQQTLNSGNYKIAKSVWIRSSSSGLSEGEQAKDLSEGYTDENRTNARNGSGSGSSSGKEEVYKERALSQLSGGQWRRVSMALDLAFAALLRRKGTLRCNLLVLDEVLTHLDAAGREAVGTVLRALTDKTMTTQSQIEERATQDASASAIFTGAIPESSGRYMDGSVGGEGGCFPPEEVFDVSAFSSSSRVTNISGRGAESVVSSFGTSVLSDEEESELNIEEPADLLAYEDSASTRTEGDMLTQESYSSKDPASERKRRQRQQRLVAESSCYETVIVILQDLAAMELEEAFDHVDVVVKASDVAVVQVDGRNDGDQEDETREEEDQGDDLSEGYVVY